MDTEDDGSWMSYGELAETRGIDRQSARRLASRQRWRRQKDNAGIVRVLVPDYPPTVRRPIGRQSAVSMDASAVTSTATPADKEDASAVTPADLSILVRPLETAIEVLREQLARERERADRAEAEVTVLRQAEAERRGRGLLARVVAAWRGA